MRRRSGTKSWASACPRCTPLPRTSQCSRREQVRESQRSLLRAPSGGRPLRPSSIDGRRPSSNLNMRVDAPDAMATRPRRALSRGRSFTKRGTGESQELTRDAPPSYGSESDGSEVGDAMHLVPASELPPLSLSETAVLSMQFAVVWFAANWTFVAALGYTSVASGTTLGSSSGFFTLLLGSMVGTDSFSPGKLASVFLSFFGVALVAWADSGAPHAVGVAPRPILGDVLAIVSAMCTWEC